MQTRVLILSCSAGFGHIRAGQALEAAFQAMPGVTAEHHDVLKFMHPVFRMVYSKGYELLAEHLPFAWKMVYDATNDVPGGTDSAKALNAHFAGDFFVWMKQHSFDAVVCTHFLPPELVQLMRDSHQIHPHLSTVVTDYDLHMLWGTEGLDLYFAPCDEIAAEFLKKTKVMPVQVRTCGIPLMPAFSQPHDRAALRKKLNLRAEVPTVLFLSSGFAPGAMQQTVQLAAQQAPSAVQLLAIAGRNHSLQSALKAIALPPHVTLHVFPFIDYVHELMAVSDFVCGKAGGLSTSETIAMGLPMVITHAIAGQEEANAAYLTAHGAAMFADTAQQQTNAFALLLQQKETLSEMKQNALRIGRPHAAHDIARNVLEAMGNTTS